MPIDTKKNIKKQKLKKFLLTVIVLATLVIVTFIFAIKLEEKKEIERMDLKYEEAISFMNEEKYEEAISCFDEIVKHKDSEEKIKECNDRLIEINQEKLKKYIGIYDETEIQINDLNGDEEPFGYKLEITGINIGVIEFNLAKYFRKVDIMSGTAKLIDGTYKFSVKDSWGNIQKGTIELLEDKVKIVISNIIDSGGFNVENGEIEFRLSNKKEINKSQNRKLVP